MTPTEVSHALLNHFEQADFDSLFKKYQPHLSHEVVRQLSNTCHDEQYRDPQRALKISELNIHVAEIVAQPETIGVAIWNQGNVYAAMNHFEQAEDCFLAAEKQFDPQKDTLRIAGLRINRVGNLCGMGHHDEALELADAARELCLKIGEAAEIFLGNLELTVGWVYEELSEYEKALEVYKNGRILFKKNDKKLQVALIDNNRAHLFQLLNNFERANQLLTDARITFEEGDYVREIARVDLNLGEMAYKLGQHQKALQHLDSSYQGFALIPIDTEMAYVNLKRSEVYLQLNLLQETIQMADEAMLICRKQKMMREFVKCQINLGIGNLRLGNLELAGKFFDRARRHAKKQNTPLRLVLVDLHRAEHAYQSHLPKRSKRIIQRLLKHDTPVMTPIVEAQARVQLAKSELALDYPNFELIDSELEEAMSICKKYGLKQAEAETYSLLGNTAVSQNELETGMSYYQKAVQLIREIKSHFSIDEFQIGYLDAQLSVYEKYIAAVHQAQLQDSSQIDNLILILNEAQVASIPLQAIAGRVESTELRAFQNRWNWLQNKIEDPEFDGELSYFESQIHEVESQISEAYRKAQLNRLNQNNDRRQGQEELSERLLRNVQSKLRSKQGIIQFYESDGMLHGVFVTTETVQWVSNIVETQKLQRQIKAWQFYLNYDFDLIWDSQVAQSHLKRYFQTVWQALSTLTSALKQLILIVPPAWQSIPFAGLFDGEMYLVEQMSITYLSSLDQFLHAYQLKPSSQKRAVVFGYSQNGRLPATVQEAEAVATLLDRNHDVGLYLESEATAQTLQALSEQADIVHLASHAIFRPDNPLFSWIELAEGRLTMADIYHWTLKKRPLVVLSACETGQGVPRGGGLMGLTRSLRSAGAGELIISQWRLEDSGSAQVVARFYQELSQAGGQNTAVALQAAQKWAIAQGISPILWASYIYMGD